MALSGTETNILVTQIYLVTTIFRTFLALFWKKLALFQIKLALFVYIIARLRVIFKKNSLSNYSKRKIGPSPKDEGLFSFE